MGKKSPRATSTSDQTASTASTDSYPLLSYLDGLVEKLREHVPQALMQWDETAIHQARVSTRRLKAALELFRPVLSNGHRRPFNRATRDLRRRLGPLRDADVMLGHLRALADAGKHPAAVAWLTGQLVAERDRARAASVGQAAPSKVLGKPGSWRGVREEMREAADAVDCLLAESVHLQLDAFAEQADRLVCQPEPDAGEADDGDEPEPPAEDVESDVPIHQDPHELRIAGKALRYTLEMAREHGHPLSGRVTKQFKEMQEALGLWHDYVVLTEQAMRASLDQLLPHHDVALQVDVLNLARLTLARADRQLTQFASLWVRQGERLTRTIRQSFPLVRPAASTATASSPDDADDGAIEAPCVPAAEDRGAAPVAEDARGGDEPPSNESVTDDSGGAETPAA